MKVRSVNMLGNVSKLISVTALSAVLVACGGGTSGDDTGLDGGLIDSGGLDGGFDIDGDDDFIDGLDGGDTLTDEELLGNNDTSVLDPNAVCQGLGGSDEFSTDAEWNNNCWLDYDIVRDDGDVVTRSPFYNSTYVMGMQRVLFCREAAGTADNIDAWADGFFGINTFNAIRGFQTAEGLTVDGRVGPETWGRMQVLVEDVANRVEADSDTRYSAYGVAQVASPTTLIDCSQQANFFAEFETDPGSEDIFAGWEISRIAGASQILDLFGISAPTAISGSTD